MPAQSAKPLASTHEKRHLRILSYGIGEESSYMIPGIILDDSLPMCATLAESSAKENAKKTQKRRKS